MATPIPTVKPGDLISSDLMNQMITLLNAHDALLGGTSAAISVSSVQPSVARVGDEIKVFGSGLDLVNLKSIAVEATNVSLGLVKPGSSGSLLIFDVPPLLLPPTGKTAVVSVENKGGASAFGSFFALPSLQANLEATFNLTRTTVTPGGNLAAGTAYDFTFSIEAFSSLDETYVLHPQLTGASPGWTVAVKGGGTEVFIPKSQPTPSTTPVVLVVTAGPSGGATLTLGLSGKNFPSVTGSSLPEAIAIGSTPGAPNLDVEFLSPTVLGSIQKFANGSLYVRTDAIVANQKAVVNPLNVRLKNPGVYNIGAPIVSNGSWTVNITNSPMSFNTTGTPNAIKGILFNVAAAAAAPDADLEIPVQGQGGLPSGSFKCKLKLRTDPSNPIPL